MEPNETERIKYRVRGMVPGWLTASGMPTWIPLSRLLDQNEVKQFVAMVSVDIVVDEEEENE